MLKNDKKITLIFLLLLFLVSNVGFFLSIAGDSKINVFYKLSEDEMVVPFVDQRCQFTKLEVLSRVNQINEFYDSDIVVEFYQHPTSNLYCQGKPVYSGYNSETFETKEVKNIAIGIGTFSDLENVERTSIFVLLFFVITSIVSKFKNIKFNYKKPKIISFLPLFVISFIYVFFVSSSFINAVSNYIIPIFLGNLLFYIATCFFEDGQISKSIISLSIFPLLLNDSNLSFFWYLILFLTNKIIVKEIVFPKKILFFNLFLFIPFIFNIQNYFFSKPTKYFDWILFKFHKHQGGIVQMENGSQSAIYLLDLLILIFVLSTLIKYTIKSFNNNNEKFFDSLIFGFMIWFFIYFVSQINTVINFEIIRIFGLNEPIDTIFTTQPDGLNWRGVTPSHELTGLWLLIITCCSINMFLKTKKVYFILTLALNLIALSWNSQRTPLILLFLFIIYIVFSYRFINLRAVLTIITVVGITFVIFDSGIDRLTDRISRISPTYEIEHGTYWELGQSLKRFEKFDIDTKQPDYDFRSLNGYDEFYQKELGIKNSTLLRTMNFTAKAFGRQIQWSRFIYLNDMEGKDFIFGKGPGQSNEVLVQLIEKPHSLYFTVYYQYGIFGILLLLSLILSVFHKIKLYSLRPEYLMCLFFFVIGLKSEFVMTHNQIVFFIVFVSFTLSSRK